MAVRRRERRVRSWWRHEQASVRMALVTAGHHSFRKAAGIEVGVQTGTILVPVTEYVAPAPAVVSDVPATVIEYMSSAPVIGYLAPAPAVSYSSSGLVNPQFSLTADETSHVAPAVSLSVPSQQLPVVYTKTTVTTDDLEEFTEPVYDHVHQEQIFAGETTENIVEIPVVQEQVIAQALPEVVDSLPPVEDFTEPGFNQVHHEQNPAIPVVTEYFPMTDDEGSELSAGVRPAPLEEGRPQGKLQRHAGIGYELVLAVLCYRWWNSCWMSTISSPRACRLLPSRLFTCPRSSLRTSPRDVCVATRNWRNNWWKCRRSHLIPGFSLVWSTTSTFQFLVVVGVVDVSDALVSGRSLSVVGNRAPQRIMKQNIRMKSPRRSFTNTLSTLSIMGVYGGLLGSGLATMRVGSWLRQTDPRLAPHFGAAVAST